ncbi:MAG: hypothetical protein ACRCZP_11700 [Phycicoccus sp.]
MTTHRFGTAVNPAHFVEIPSAVPEQPERPTPATVVLRIRNAATNADIGQTDVQRFGYWAFQVDDVPLVLVSADNWATAVGPLQSAESITESATTGAAAAAALTAATAAQSTATAADSKATQAQASADAAINQTEGDARYVRTVNGTGPDGTGNVTVAGGGGASLPTGGATGTVLQKSSAADGDATWQALDAADLTPGAVVALPNSTTQLQRTNIPNDGSATTSWPDRFAFFYDGTRTGYFNEYGELRARPAKNNTVALRAMGHLSPQAGINVFEVATNLQSNVLFGVSADAAVATVPVRATNLHQRAVFGADGPLTVRSGTARFYNDTSAPLLISHVRAQVLTTGPTGAAIIIDVNRNGTTIYGTQSNRPTIPAGSAAGTAVVGGAPSITSLAPGEYLSVDIDQIGSTVAGTGLVVTVGLT